MAAQLVAVVERRGRGVVAHAAGGEGVRALHVGRPLPEQMAREAVLLDDRLHRGIRGVPAALRLRRRAERQLPQAGGR